MTSQDTKIYDWFTTDDGRSIYRAVERPPRGERSTLACPSIVRPFDEPVQSMANGKWYTSKSDLAASHRASGNPHGIDFVEVGNEPMPAPAAAPKIDMREVKEDVRAAKADLEAGWRPDVAFLED